MKMFKKSIYHSDPLQWTGVQTTTNSDFSLEVIVDYGLVFCPETTL